MIRIEDIKFAALHRTTSIKIRSLCDDCTEECKTVEECIFRSFSDRQKVLDTILQAYEKLVGHELNSEGYSSHEYTLQKFDDPLTTPLIRKLKERTRNPESNDSPVGLNGLPDLLRGRLASDEVSELENNILSSPARSRRSTWDESFSHHLIDEVIMESKESPADRKKDVQKEWKALIDASMSEYPEVAVACQALPISLNTFYDTFLRDDAPHSMRKFQESIIKDKRVQCTEWSPKHDSLQDVVECMRQITAQHQRKARVGPSSVPLERTQTIRSFTNIGIAINTALKLGGIPYGDTFEMRDEWIIEAKGDKEVIISVGFKIHFIKAPMAMVRKVIMNQSKSEISTWFDSYINMVKTVIGGDQQTVKIVDRKGHEMYSRSFLFIVIRASLFIIALFTLAYHNFTLTQNVALLESEMHRIQSSSDRVTLLESNMHQMNSDRIDLIESEIHQIQISSTTEAKVLDQKNNDRADLLESEMHQIQISNKITAKVLHQNNNERIDVLESKVSQIQMVNMIITICIDQALRENLGSGGPNSARDKITRRLLRISANQKDAEILPEFMDELFGEDLTGKEYLAARLARYME